MASVLSAAPFTKHQLGYRAPTATAGAYATGTVTAFVSVDKARQLQLLPGADAELTPVKVELVSPLTLPAGVGQGSTLTLTWEGVASQVLVTAVVPNDLVGVAFGALLLGELRPA